MLKKVLLGLCLTITLLLVGGYIWVNNNKSTVYNFATSFGAEKAGLERKQVTVDQHAIHYLENGLKDSKPTILLVHGFGAFKENWIQLALLLKDDYHLVSVDLPGHGESSYFEDTNYDIDQQASMLNAFTQKVIGRPFIMVGNSMGGSITALYTANHPEDIKAAVLIDPGHIVDIKSPFNLQVKNGLHPLIVETREEFDYMIEFVMEQPPYMPWPMADVSTLRMAERKAKNQKIWVDITENPKYNFKDEIKRIKAPTLILWGKKDRVLHYKNAYIFGQLIKTSTVEIFEGVGHVPMLEVPQQTALAIKKFLAVANL